MIRRFLLLFEQHRDALSRAQRAEDDVLHWRSRSEEIEAKLSDVQSDALNRERELYDRLTVKPVREPQSFIEPDPAKIPLTVKKWQSQTTKQTLDAMEERRNKLLAN